MKTLFITGAEGFAGKHLVARMQAAGWDVVGGVRNRARKLAFEKQSGKALVCEVSDAINVARAIATVKPDAVVHLAGTSRAYEAAIEPLTAYQSIVTAWANVLDAVRRVTPDAKVLMVSACDVYGGAGDDGKPIPETVGAEPVSTFGALKLAAEAIAHTYFQNYHLDITIARPFHYTGPNQPETFFFGAVAHRLAEWDGGDSARLQLPDLDCYRDVLHVNDLIDAYIALLDKGKPNEIYNVASGKCYTVRSIVEQLIRARGVHAELVELPADDSAQMKSLCGSHAKITGELGWTPKIGFEQTVRELIDSYVQSATVTTS